MKRILVTGGAGFIGSNFIKYILKKYPKYIIVNYDKLTYAGNLENLKEIKKNKNYYFVKGDICNEKRVDETIKKFKIDSIIHFAAESHVDNSILNPNLFTKTNIIGTQTLLNVARQNGNLRFHHISTDEVFGTLKKTDPKFNEDTKYSPNSPYSASKASSDFLVRIYNKVYDLPVTLSNCSNNYGPNQHTEKLIPKIITNCMEGIDIPIYNKGNEIRDWLYVEDHCEAIDKIFHEGVIGETYCVGGNCEKTNMQIVKSIFKKIEHPDSKISHVKDRKNHDYRYAMNTSKIKKKLKWQPKTSFEDGIQKTINYYKQQTKIKRFNSYKKIAILGSKGMLGVDLCKHFKNAQAFDRTKLDITNKKDVFEKLKNFDLIINATGYTDVEKSGFEMKSMAKKVNVTGVHNIVQVCKKNNSTLVHFSTDYVFDGKTKKGFEENSQTSPINYYGLTKAQGEREIQKHLKKYYLIRTSLLFGKSKTNFVQKIISKAKNKETLKLVNDQFSCPTYTKDLVLWTQKILGETYGIYHFSNFGICTPFQFAKEILKQAKLKTKIIPIKTKDYTSRVERPKYSILLNTKFESLPKWQDALKRYLKEK